MAADDVIAVAAVRKTFVPASGPMLMSRFMGRTRVSAGTRFVRNSGIGDVLVYVAGVNIVQMTVMEIVDVSAVAHGLMSATFTVLMLMIAMRCVLVHQLLLSLVTISNSLQCPCRCNGSVCCNEETEDAHDAMGGSELTQERQLQNHLSLAGNSAMNPSRSMAARIRHASGAGSAAHAVFNDRRVEQGEWAFRPIIPPMPQKTPFVEIAMTIRSAERYQGS